MHILLTNDDGYYAKGLQSLAEHLRIDGHEITIVAPLSERSAASHSLTLRKPIRVNTIKANDYTVDGTPVDSVVIAIQKLVQKPIDLVISGINSGQNMGEDIHYSGTVAAAKEAAFFGYKAIAVSINEYTNQNFGTAARIVCKIIANNIIDVLHNTQVLNVNVPNLDFDELKGIRLTKTGHRKYYNFISLIESDNTGFSYTIGGDKPIWDLVKGTDAEAVSLGYVSLTPLGFDMTKGEHFPVILEWIEENQSKIGFTFNK